MAALLAQSTTTSVYRNFLFFALFLIDLGQAIAQAVALSTSLTTNVNNISLVFESDAEINLFESASKASLALALAYLGVVTLSHLHANGKLPFPRATLMLLACTTLILQFSLSFQSPSFCLVLARKLLAFMAFFGLSLEVVYSFVKVFTLLAAIDCKGLLSEVLGMT